MKFQPILSPKSSLRQWLKRLLRIAVGALILAGVLMVNSNLLDLHIGGMFKINPIEIFTIGGDLFNNGQGDFTNSGQIYYRGDITNNALMNCDVCTSGSNYIENTQGDQQTIMGNQAIKWYDGIINNPQGLELKNELQIVNHFEFKEGIIETDRSLTNQFLHFLTGASASNAQDNQHVNGYVAKSGIGSFTFPIGDGSTYKPIGIEGNQLADFFKAAYYNTHPDLVPVTANGPFTTSLFEQDYVAYVHTKGYWDIQGTSDTRITLHWNPNDQISNWVQGVDTVVVLGWDGTTWVSLGNFSFEGNLSTGSVTSNLAVPDNYTAFTLGKATLTHFPLEWLDFSAVWQGQDGDLEWITSHEINVHYFDIQRSIDGRVFESIGKTPATGNSNSIQTYEFLDEGIGLKDISRFFYRIKEVDFDGKFDYSKVIELRQASYKPHLSLKIYPNPTTSWVNVHVEGHSHLSFRLIIVNMAGQTVYQSNIQGTETKRLSVEELSSGFYHIKVYGANLNQSKQLIISR